ncbi:MAG: hypothetical protein ACYS6W_16100, partial [Planctomycetota bacterium]
MSPKRNRRKKRKPPSWLKQVKPIETPDPEEQEEIPPPSDWKRENVFLCIPSTGEEHVNLSGYVEAELRYSGHEIVTMRSVAKPTDFSRNKTIDAFLEAPAAQNCDWYYTVDSDTIPFAPKHPEVPEGTLNRLLSHKKNVICGMTFSTKAGNLWIPIMFEKTTSLWC